METDLIKMVESVAKAQTERFPNGNDPYKIACRLLEEAGETVWELNHFERNGVSVQVKSNENKENFVLEMYQVFLTLVQMLQYFGLEPEFRKCIETVFNEYVNKGYLADENLKVLPVDKEYK